MLSWNSSAVPLARPPETTIFAPPSSGRSDFVTSSETKLAVWSAAGASTASMRPEPPSPAAAANAVGRTVATILASEVVTGSSALPA